MVTIPIKTHLEPNGTLNLSVPTGLPESDVDVVVIVQPLGQASVWPEGFFEETYGSFADRPLERGGQLRLDEREALR
jgi:hypothetical protein